MNIIFLLSKVVVTNSNYLNWNSQNKLKDVVYENTVEKELKREDRGEKVIANYSPFNRCSFLDHFSDCLSRNVTARVNHCVTWYMYNWVGGRGLNTESDSLKKNVHRHISFLESLFSTLLTNIGDWSPLNLSRMEGPYMIWKIWSDMKVSPIYDLSLSHWNYDWSAFSVWPVSLSDQPSLSDQSLSLTSLSVKSVVSGCSRAGKNSTVIAQNKAFGNLCKKFLLEVEKHLNWIEYFSTNMIVLVWLVLPFLKFLYVP